MSDAVGLYRATLDVDDATLAALTASLSPAERAQGAARRDPIDRRRWLAERGWRRRLLAGRLGCAPADIDYVVGERGKPRVAGGGVSFNASRSGATALYAIGDHEVGVDVEQIDAERDLTALARRLFAPGERAAYAATPPEHRRAALYACWTRKEAAGKARGAGLVFPLDEIEVWRGDAGSIRVGEVVVADVALEPGLAGAVAVVADAGDPRLPDIPEWLAL